VTEQEHEGIRVTDKRRIDPDTFEMRTPLETPELSEAEAEFDEVEAKVAELTDDLRRVHAEYANYRKRIERDREAARILTVGAVITDLLPVLDDIERAREHGELEGAFRTVAENLESTISRYGLERFGAVDESFDPALHEALTSEVRDGLEAPIVATLFQPGYRYAGRVLRPARVGVADGS
jgi:molecular chaperone GrpE